MQNESLLKLINKLLLQEGVELTLKMMPEKAVVKLTTSCHTNGKVSEHELVRRERNCTVISTYRNGRRSGMKLIKSEVLPFNVTGKCRNGDSHEQPLTGHSVALLLTNDTA
jgi:hypothetical protein